MRIIRSRGFRLIIFLVSLGALITAPRSLFEMWQRRDIGRERQEVRDDLASKNEELKRELMQAQTPEYIEEVAREKLGLIKEGETIILMPNDKLQMTNENQEENIANWKKWLRLFF
ncbi:hypothetical protein A2875_05395 [Candidatus Gottesmanbacteria bacterium RIFCSPHIGHO2_01_FULL_46_14]|uniref:Septum formation initiator n=2 Tax=Candidatus Gottesmaniibacteriota TaxID=1752720 RepID=A0A1F5ZKJ9_9BACT|nr:MAG: hypothetical protein A2875_05395 [Candidatus Gottesmanbacteria bacterium RIFCSPHIGHO2_01_FULL_46_14]OGG28585.1 MAG: hypothetical protein A2971_01690 [Candidatus Gottesmanbacteria bacterium RIFCSPLOWO2_01_FULL_46_21]